MKKLALLIAVLSLFAVACSTDTTIDATASGADTDTESEGSTSSAEEPTAVSDDTEAGESDTNTTDEAPEPTAEAAEPEPTAVEAEATPTEVPEAEPTPEPVEPAPETAEAIRAVVEADDWCAAASAVEEGTGALDTLNFNDPVELEQGLTQALAVISSSKRLVPNEIAADLDQSIEGFTTLLVALEEAEWKFIDLDLNIISVLDGPMELATYNIESYNFTECGIGPDPGLPPVIADDGTVEGSDPTPEFDGTIRDQAVAGLVEAGFSEAEANCIFENLDFTNPEITNDPAALLAVFGDCGISLDRLAQLGG